MDQARILREMYDPRLRKKEVGPRVIAVTSGKGGVGKTGLSANLASILARKKYRVLLLDADTGLANLDVVLGLCPKYNLYHVLKGEVSMEEALLEGPGGFHILPASSGIQSMTELSPGQKVSLLEILNSWPDKLDFLIVDTAAGISANVMYFNRAAGETLVVVTPEPTSLTDAYALIKILFQHYAKKKFLLVVNMVKNRAEGEEVYRRLNRATDHFLNLALDYLGCIPEDANFKKAVKKQSLLVDLFPQSPATLALGELAAKIEETTVSCEPGAINFL
jgi:flagellar biosynthesis protein FlhG